jgi:hypothetical protein
MGFEIIQAEIEGKLPASGYYKWLPRYIKNRVLGLVGFRSAWQFYNENLTGQKIQYRSDGEHKGMPAKSGRRLVSFRRDSGSVSISSFPLNAFKNKRILRSGQTGPQIFRSAKGSLRIGEYAKAALENITNDFTKRSGK